ncbi:hypothetical protein [Rhodobacter capsulatus]|uniref:hypothetical protein n=1 Tax=Rhodobacter capsulatus TaxID=1061 RepID=UPI00402521F5
MIRTDALIVHHTSAADAAKPRGSTAMQGNADTVLVLRQPDVVERVMADEKNRYGHTALGGGLCFPMRLEHFWVLRKKVCVFLKKGVAEVVESP